MGKKKYNFILENKEGDMKLLSIRGRVPSEGEIIDFSIDKKHLSKLAHLNETIYLAKDIEDFNRRYNKRKYKVEKITNVPIFCGKNLELKVYSVKVKEIQ